MQHRHIDEAIDHTFQDIHNFNAPFGGLSIVFGGNFQQIFLVISKGPWPDVVNTCMQCSQLWSSVKILHLTQNMHLNVGLDEDVFAQ